MQQKPKAIRLRWPLMNNESVEPPERINDSFQLALYNIIVPNAHKKRQTKSKGLSYC